MSIIHLSFFNGILDTESVDKTGVDESFSIVESIKSKESFTGFASESVCATENRLINNKKNINKKNRFKTIRYAAKISN